MLPLSRPKAAALSQLAGLGTVVIINATIYLTSLGDLARYSLATAPALLVIAAIDPGLNQEELLNRLGKPYGVGKIATWLMASMMAAAFLFDRSLSVPLWLISAYSGAALGLTYCQTKAIEGGYYAFDAFSRGAVFLAVLLSGIVHTTLGGDVVIEMLAFQGASMLLLSAASWARVGQKDAPAIGGMVGTLTRLLPKIVLRGALLNVVSNGLILIVGIAGGSERQIVDVRFVALGALTIVALTPAAPMHYWAFTAAERRRVRMVLAGLASVTVIGCLIAFFFRSSSGVLGGSEVLPVAAGGAAGVVLSAANLRLGELPLVNSAMYKAGGSVVALLAGFFSLWALDVPPVVGSVISITLASLLCIFLLRRYEVRDRV